MTSDEFLFAARGEARLYEIAAEQRKTLAQQVFGGFGAATRDALENAVVRLSGAPK